MAYKYSRKFEKEDNLAKAVGMDLPVSTKHCIEICSWIKNKKLQNAINMLEEVIKEKRSLPFKRFNKGVGHKKEGMAGRYPKKACLEVLKLLNTISANAQFKGLNNASLGIIHICAQKAATPWHYGRFFRRKMKRTHVEVIVEEKEKAPKKQTEKTPIKKESKPTKTEEKKEVKKP